jgi:arylsulfatase A-like enzyme
LANEGEFHMPEPVFIALAISWPERIKARGEIRSEFHYVIDIMPTTLEAAGLPQSFTLQDFIH